MSGSIYEFIRYRNNCPNNWENMNLKEEDKTICKSIAYNIEKINDPVVNMIIQSDPQCTKIGDPKCFERINKFLN